MRVIVIGGGPGGSVTAARLRQLEHDVIVLEKAAFPRFHLGESLLPKSLPILEAIGILPTVHERFLVKRGARFHDDMRDKKDRFSFDGAWKPEPAHAYQVDRGEFDQILLSHAASLGADVRMETKADRVVFENDRAVGVEVGGKRLDADFVVDASGRDVVMARGATSKIEGLEQTALYGHFSHVPRGAGDEEGDVDIVLFESGEPERPNWFWFIPFKDGPMSVGAVVSKSWMRARAGASPDSLFADAVRGSKTATSLMADAKPVWPAIEATADFSYRTRAMSGLGWLAVGDASGFIDPLFSTGAHLAMVGGYMAADAIHAGAVPDWETQMRAASETFVSAVQAFYRGPLIEHLFVENKRTALRRSITSLLAGDVFGDAVWLRDVRLRLKEM